MKTTLKIGLIISMILFMVSCQVPKASQEEISEPEENIIYIVGTPTRVYPYSGASNILDWGDGQKVRLNGRLVEYSSVNQRVTQKFNGLELNAKTYYLYKDVEYNASRIYMEVINFENVETNEIIEYQLRLLDESYFTDPDSRVSSYYAKCITFYDLQDIKS